MSIEHEPTDEAERLRPDAVARVDEPEELLYADGEQPDDDAPPPSPYPDGPGRASTGAAASEPGPYPDGWGPQARSANGYDTGATAPHGPIPYGAAYGGLPGANLAPYAEPSPYAVTQYDPATEFEPPADLPPWYEDQYYDDRDWERLPRGTSTIFRVLVFLMGLAVVILISGFYVKGWVDHQLDPPGEEGASVVIEIPQGATTNDIARILDEEGVVANSTVFRYYLRFKDAGDYQAGEYTFRQNMAVWDVRDVLDKGARIAESFFVTIPEGQRLTEIETTLVSQLERFDAGELRTAFTTVRTPKAFADNILFSPEGVLFPDTYEIGEDAFDNEAALLERMVTRFDQVAEEVDLVGRAEKLGYSPYQLLIIASLIEEEAKADEDRAKIARVIYNRLEAGWTLGIDATLVYALDGDRDLSQADLEVDSPFNTRLVPGLPPTPISSPGRASLEAAVRPEKGPWMYYVLTEENGPGTHTFVETDAEFQEAVQVCIERELGCG